MLEVFRHVVPNLIPEERFDLTDQLRRSCKAIPHLIAEGYGKRHQRRGFQKYLDDAMSESNETEVSLRQAKDLFGEVLNIEMCDKLISEYDKISRQLHNLARKWQSFGHPAPDSQ